MEELIEKMQELILNGLQPSLCLLGTKQMDSIRKDCLAQHKLENDPKVEYFNVFIHYNIAGNNMKIIRVVDEDFCEVYAKDKYIG